MKTGCEGSRGFGARQPAAAQLNRHEASGDLAQRHRYQRKGPRGSIDVMNDAKAAYRLLRTMAEREYEYHPGADSQDQQAAREPADSGNRDTIATDPDMRREATKHAQREPDRGEKRNQHEIVAGCWDRMDITLRDEEDDY